MKKYIAILTLIMTGTLVSWGQKYAFVDTEYILNNIPSYKAAQDKLNNISKQWEKEIQDKYAEIDKLYKASEGVAYRYPLVSQDHKQKQRYNPRTLRETN